MKACKGKTKPGKVSPAVSRGKAGKAGKAGKKPSRGKAGSPTWAGKFPAARTGRLGRKGGTSPA